MSKVNATSQITTKAQQANTQKINTAKMKKKEWMAKKFRKKKPLPQAKEKAKPSKTLPPKDAQQFSANWKALQEVGQDNNKFSLYLMTTVLAFSFSNFHRC